MGKARNKGGGSGEGEEQRGVGGSREGEGRRGSKEVAKKDKLKFMVVHTTINGTKPILPSEVCQYAPGIFVWV